MKKSVLVCVVIVFLLTGCVSEIYAEETSGVVTSGSIFISEITSEEVIPFARIVIGGDNSYTVEITAVSGHSIFTALRENYEEVTTLRGTWLHFESTRHATGDTVIYLHTHPTRGLVHHLSDGVHYLYIGSLNQMQLTGVNITITGTGSTAEIEFLRGDMMPHNHSESVIAGLTRNLV